MHWQFGGNLEPVRMICEVDWRECPKAIANYVWSEIITDVLDCLRNESVVWRVLGVFFVCTVLLRVICSKGKRENSDAVDKDVLNKVGYKVEDLELKVNILTYKLQYGAWPLPHQVRKSNFRKNLRNLRLTLSNPNDRNNWIKHVLLSPRRNDSCVSHAKYYPSEHCLTELFDAKKRSTHAYLRRERLPIEHSSKSSKSSSDKSLKLSPVFKGTVNRKRRDAYRHENLEMQHRNAISLPLFSKRRNGKSGRKARNDFRLNDKMTPACRNYTKTMDDCKRYLKELHDSNKNLGLVSSSSEISNESSVKNVWSDTQHRKSIEPVDLIDLSETPREARTSKQEKGENSKMEANKIPGNTEERCLELSNAIYPVLRLLDKRLLSSKMNIKFCADMFPQPTASNVLIPVSNERRKFTPSSREALHQVKKKLESLHNVLRMYELQSSIATKSSKAEEDGNAKRAQNTDTLVAIANEDYDWTKIGNSNGNFDNDFNKQTSNSSEQCESDDETGRSSIVSIRAYSNVFNNENDNNNNNYRVNNVNEPYRLLMEKTEPNRRLEIIPNNQIIYPSGVKCEKIPERIYYAISSESFEDKGIKAAENFATPAKTFVENQPKGFDLREQFSAPMETDDDVIVSPSSSRTELSKDSEFEDKPTAILLQEALQFKQALLTRVELEKVCFPRDEKVETSDESATLGQSKYSYVNNNLQTKFLDIISEEQSISSSTEKTSRTYMFFNLKQDKLLNFAQQQIGRDSSKRFLESNENLETPSEYFSFSNVNQEANADNSFDRSDENIASNVEVKHLDESLEESDEKLLKFASCLNATQMDLRKKESFDDRFNDFVDRNINSVELFSQDLDEAPLFDDKAENSFSFESPKVAKKSLEDSSKIDALNVDRDDDKYLEDNEITCNPNLILKRNPGAYSLIEQTMLLGPGKRQMHGMIMNDETIYDVSASESKETSVETNLIQNSTTSSFNQSNDSNVPETFLIDKSLDEGKLKDANWREADISHDFIGEKDAKTCSTNTITLRKYDATKMDDYRGNDDNVASVRDGRMEENPFANFVGESNEAAEFYKSIYNLISPHSSVYFTDEASSSAAKLNNAHSKNRKGLSRNDEEEDKSRYNGENLNDGRSNVIDVNDKRCNEKVCANENLPGANNETGCDENNDKENADSFNETETRKKDNDTRNLCDDDCNHLSAMGNVSRERTPRSNAERLSLEQYLISPNSSPKEATRKSNATMKSKSHESYGKSMKSTQPNVKGLKSDGANIAKPKMESNVNSIFTKLQDLSEFRRNTEDSIRLDKKRSKSQVSFRMDENCAESLDSKLKLRTHLKSLSPTPKTSSRSCIPILKSRLEAARRSESESRPRSPVRGPLTMTMCWRGDNLCDKDRTMTDEIQVEGKSKIVRAPMEESVKDSAEKANDDGNHKQDTLKRSQTQTIGNELGQQEQMVIYVNIFTKYDRNSTKIVDPNKFLEFVKNRKKLSTQKFSSDKREVGEVRESPENEKDTMHKIVTVVSSVINGNELDETTSSNLSKMQNDSLSNSLLNGRLKNVCLFSVEQREIDVTAKPSVIDTSTSISDLENVSGGGRNKFQISGTPKELNNEEYVALLEILHQEPNIVHLEELQNVCKKLASEYPKI